MTQKDKKFIFEVCTPATITYKANILANSEEEAKEIMDEYILSLGYLDERYEFGDYGSTDILSAKTPEEAKPNSYFFELKNGEVCEKRIAGLQRKLI